jgi:hypothetical protein
LSVALCAAGNPARRAMEVPRYAVGKIAHRARIRYMQS